jgi:hypothetical protein
MSFWLTAFAMARIRCNLASRLLGFTRGGNHHPIFPPELRAEGELNGPTEFGEQSVNSTCVNPRARIEGGASISFLDYMFA